MGIPNGFYQDAMSSYFGNLTETGMNSLWAGFLSNNGLTSGSPNIITPDAVTQSNFVSYLQTVLSNVLPGLSPDEQKKRIVMLSAFDLALKMLSTLQNSVVVQSQNLIFYGKWQEEYTRMMARVPVYISTDPLKEGISRPSTVPSAYDPTTFKLGYNDISVQDIGDYVATKPGTTFRIAGAAGSAMPSMTFSSSPTNGAFLTATFPQNYTFATNSMIASIPSSFFTTPDGDPYELNTNPPSSVSMDFSNPASPTIIVSVSANASTKVAQNVGDAFKIFYYSVLGNPISTRDPGASTTAGVINTATLPNTINGVIDSTKLPYIRNDTKIDGADADESRLRAERNAQNQQFIENIRSFRQIVQDTSKTVEANLSSTREGISQQSNLLSSIMDSLKGLIGAIFKA